MCDIGSKERGERLIEQSSSWFPPKCLSGQLETDELRQVKQMIRSIGVFFISTYSQPFKGIDSRVSGTKYVRDYAC